MKMKHIKTEVAPVIAGNCPYDGNPVRRDSVMSGGVMVDGVICTHCEAEWTWHAWQREQSKAKPSPVSGHTPTPWRTIQNNVVGQWQILHGASGKTGRVCTVSSQDRQLDGTPYPYCDGDVTAKANAAFIVKACNCHDELVRALQDLLSADQMPPCEKQTELAIVAMKQARAALNKASR